MKKITMFFGGLLIAATLLVSCGKDIVPTINNFFSVNNGTLVAKEMPAVTLNTPITVTMNEMVIPGGTSYINVSSEMTPAKILVGMKDQKGYYEVAPNGDNGQYSLVMVVDQNITLEEEQTTFIILIGLQDANGDVTEYWESSVELHEVGTGILQVSLSFDNAKDVDLHLIEPEQVDENGEEVSYYDRHVYYGHSMNRNGGELDLDSNAGCSIDNINNENITYGEDAYVAPGMYQVYVDMFSNCDATIATNWVVSVFYNGSLIASQNGTNPAMGTFPVGAPSNYASLSSIEPVMTFVIPDHGQKRVKTFAPKPLSETAMQKNAMAAQD